jgi:hypothetical protein
MRLTSKNDDNMDGGHYEYCPENNKKGGNYEFCTPRVDSSAVGKTIQ